MLSRSRYVGPLEIHVDLKEEVVTRSLSVSICTLPQLAFHVLGLHSARVGCSRSLLTAAEPRMMSFSRLVTGLLVDTLTDGTIRRSPRSCVICRLCDKVA